MVCLQLLNKGISLAFSINLSSFTLNQHTSVCYIKHFIIVSRLHLYITAPLLNTRSDMYITKKTSLLVNVVITLAVYMM